MNEMLIILRCHSRRIGEEYPELRSSVSLTKTVFVEQMGASGRAIVVIEAKIDGKIYWAGYNSCNQTVYASEMR